jgi:SAM-dependent methyltransferase
MTQNQPAPPGQCNVWAGQMTDSAYSGTDVLEIMKEAKNYNRFLVCLVESYCRQVQSIVDFGAGAGTFSTLMRERGHDVTCIETDRLLREGLGQAGFTVYADLADLPPDSADFIYTLNVLEHIQDDAAALRLLRSRLRPGGRALIYVPAFQSLYSSFDRKVGHFRRYRRLALAAMLRQSGFTVQRNRYVDSLGFAAGLAYKALGNDTGHVDLRMLVAYDRAVFPLSRRLDTLLFPFIGKNLLLVVQRPE